MASLETSSARARRRPARYSPELPQSQSETSNNGVLIRNNTAHQLQEHQLQDSAGNEILTPSAVAVVVYNNHQRDAGSPMAPVAGNRGPGRPPAKHKKRKSTSSHTSKSKRQMLEEAQAQRTRPHRVANVLLENELLIDEIRNRKALWMRTHEQHHSATMTAPYWEEVAQALDLSQECVRKRWKSLKDHYRRELKKAMTDPTAPPSVWPYYKKMRFMKSQMFVSLRRKNNGEEHLELLSDDEEEELNNQWNGQPHHGKMEGDSDTQDGYDMDYNELVKLEMQMQQTANNANNGIQEEEEEEEIPEDQQQQDDVDQEEQEQTEQDRLQEEEELAALQQQQTLRQRSNLPIITTIAELVGNVNLPTIVTTTATSLSGLDQQELSGRINAIQQHRASEIQRSNSLGTIQQQTCNINENLDRINARHSVLQQQNQINNRLSAIQRNVEMNVIQQRANVSAMHDRAEISAMQHRAEMSALRQRNEMQQTNGVVDNNVDSSNDLSPIDDRGAISDDYHFFMSLLPHIRHFSSLQKLKVRNRITQIIIEESSNIQYDPLANC